MPPPASSLKLLDIVDSIETSSQLRIPLCHRLRYAFYVGFKTPGEFYQLNSDLFLNG